MARNRVRKAAGGGRRGRREWPRPRPPDKLIVPQEAETFIVHPNQAGMRLDQFLRVKMRYRSRARIQQMIRERAITADGKRVDQAYRLKAFEEVRIPLPPPPEEASRIDRIPLDVIYEDESLIVVNKQPNIVVHPSGRHLYDTLINALHLRYRNLEDPEKDIVPKLAHRVDRETSGVLVAVKTRRHERGAPLAFENLDVVKEYLALAEGVVADDAFEIDRPLCKEPGKNPNLALMIVHPEGQQARTGVTVVERFRGFTLLRCRLFTGRQHQIRVHLRSIGHPVVCDKLYGLRKALRLSDLRPLRDGEEDRLLLDRQALHSWRISFTDPGTDEPVAFEAPLPADMSRTLEVLRGD